MAVGDIIDRDDYNSIQTIVARVLGTGSSNTGYGQPVLSSPVSAGQKVTIQEWDDLRNDIINVYRHQNGTIPSLPSAVEAQKIRYNTSNSVWNKFLTEIQSLDSTRFTVGSQQFTTTNYGTQTRTTLWREKCTCLITLEWSTAEQARHYFNSGGSFSFLSSRTGGTTGSDTGTIAAQNTEWSNLLTAAATDIFAGNRPGTGVNPNNGQNYFRLGGSYQTVYTQSSSSPYGANTYRITARTPGVSDNSNGTARIVEFLVEWIDGHDFNVVGPDGVDGTLSLSLSSIDPIFKLVPANNTPVTIEKPSVSFGNITSVNVSPTDAPFKRTITTNQTNLNIRTYALNNGWNGSDAVAITINSGVVISGNTAGDSTAACTISGSFPNGVSLINNGTIVGRGGNGGSVRSVNLFDAPYPYRGRWDPPGGDPGNPGGTALTISVNAMIDNNGTIAGGGGGGGGGGFAQLLVWTQPQDQLVSSSTEKGGAGGGGRSSNGFNSSGGISVDKFTFFPVPNEDGQPGTFSSAGSGGSASSDGNSNVVGGAGGTGGNWGENGSPGGRGNVNFAQSPDHQHLEGTGGIGGSAGLSVKGIANVAFRNVGTVLGPVS